MTDKEKADWDEHREALDELGLDLQRLDLRRRASVMTLVDKLLGFHVELYLMSIIEAATDE